MRDCRDITAASTPPTIPLGLIATTSIARAASPSAVATSDIDERWCSQGRLVIGMTQIVEQSSLAVKSSRWENSSERIKSAGSLCQCDRLSKNTSYTIPASDSSALSMRPIFSWQWSTHCCIIVLRVGPVVTVNRKKSLQLKAHHRKAGFGLEVSLRLPRYFQRNINAALYFTQAKILSRTKLASHWEIECPRIIHRNADIMRCVENGSVDEIQRLLGTGKASPRDVTVDGTTVLHLASRTCNLELVRILILEGADLNARNEDDITPLHWAMARESNYDVARVLIENGADLANNTVDGRTPLHTLFNDTVEKILLRDDWVEKMTPDSQGMSIAHFLS